MSKNTLQGTIEQIRQAIKEIGPATKRQIETHPAVVKACRSSKTKARRHIDRLHEQGHIKSDFGTPEKFSITVKQEQQERLVPRPAKAFTNQIKLEAIYKHLFHNLD